MRKTTTKNTITILITTLIATTLITLTGCSSMPNINLSDINLGSKHTETAHREKWTTIQDIDGNKYATVLKISPITEKTLDEDMLQKVLNKNKVPYSQLIAANNMGTATTELGYLFFPETITLNEIIDTNSLINENGFQCELLTPEQYQEYINNVNPNNIYYNETTYYAPTE